MLKNKLQALFNPEQYHGWGKSKKYFEGWYYKIVNAAEDKAFAIIPGIAMNETGAQHAFVQILDGKNLHAEFHKFEASEFVPSSGKFEVRIADNYFSSEKLLLNLPTATGELTFNNRIPWPSSWYSPNIMGPFSFVPFMECSHGILSMNHAISGQLTINNETIDFTGGKGYMEKDWGHSFPSAYIWIQTNHFNVPDVSLKVSVAKIPWLTGSFVGFIAGLWLNGEIIEFTTYNFTKLRRSFADSNCVEIVSENSSYMLEVFANRAAGTKLASPILGFMDGRIEESLTANIGVKLTDNKTGKVLFHDSGRNAGLEVAGKIEEILVG